MVPRENKNNAYANFGGKNKEYYGIFRSGLLTWSPKNGSYHAMCYKCNLQYVGPTSTEFKIRFRNHKSNMLNNRRACEMAVHDNIYLNIYKVQHLIFVKQCSRQK